MNKLFYKDYLNNISDLIAISKNINFKSLLDKINKKEYIKVNSHLIHKQRKISSTEQFIFNLDNYITYIKSKLFINQFDLQNIIDLTIYNKNNKILYLNIYYYDDPESFINGFKKMFMNNYNENYKKLKKYININKMNFDELTNYINSNKKRPYIYFENINSNNIAFYIDLFKEMSIVD